MPEPLKYLYNREFIDSLCREFRLVYSQFNSKGFRESIFDTDWDEKELKDRMRHISQTLHRFLPNNYQKSLEILKPVSEKFSGFEPMFFPDFVEIYGLEDYKQSIMALEHFTKYSSSEFAVRPFIKKYKHKMMAQMGKWAESNNHHVRRLATEGCRPRLPWAMALPEFKKNPQPVIKILEKLRNDPSESVRRSVANNLNDISKDSPQILIEIAKKWLRKNSETDWLVKHACRTLLKKGKPEIMKIFGFEKPNHISIEGFKVQMAVNLGDRLKFSFHLKTQKNQLGKLRIEYQIDFMKNSRKQAGKVFKISEFNYSEKRKEITKEHDFKFITTRKYYTGNHGIRILVNGFELIQDQFVVKEKD